MERIIVNLIGGVLFLYHFLWHDEEYPYEA